MESTAYFSIDNIEELPKCVCHFAKLSRLTLLASFVMIPRRHQGIFPTPSLAAITTLPYFLSTQQTTQKGIYRQARL